MDSPHPSGMGEPAGRLRPLPVKDAGDTLAAGAAVRGRTKEVALRYEKPCESGVAIHKAKV